MLVITQWFMTKDMALWYAIVWLLFVAIPLGAAIGWTVGYLMERILRRPRTRRILVIDVSAGAFGFVLGAFAAGLGGYSAYYEWTDGQLVKVRSEGLMDYRYYLAVGGAVLMVALLRGGLGLGKTLLGHCRLYFASKSTGG
jgi:hypothetical protein